MPPSGGPGGESEDDLMICIEMLMNRGPWPENRDPLMNRGLWPENQGCRRCCANKKNMDYDRTNILVLVRTLKDKCLQVQNATLRSLVSVLPLKKVEG